MSEQEAFYFDEFCASDDGIEVEIPIRGRKVPLRIRRGLTLKEKAAASAAAIQRRVDPATGQITIVGVDEAAAAEAIALKMLVSWPFVTRDGSPVPITKENVSRLMGGMMTLVELANKMEEQGDAALAPFVPQSAGDYVMSPPIRLKLSPDQSPSA